MFRKFSLKAKLLMFCSFYSLIAIFVGAVGYLSLVKVSVDYGFIANQSLPKVQATEEMLSVYRAIRVQVRTLGITGVSAKENERAVKETIALIDLYESTKKEYLKTDFVAGEKELYETADKAWEDFKAIGGKILALNKSARPEDHAEMIRIFFEDCPEKAGIYLEKIEKLVSFHKELAKQKQVLARQSEQTAFFWLAAVILAGLGTGMAIGIVFSRSMANSLGQIVEQLGVNAGSVAEASRQIAGSAQQLSQASSEQAASLTQTAAAIDEMSSMVTKNSDNARHAAETSGQSQSKADLGQRAVEDMIRSMEEIDQSNQAIMSQVNDSNQRMSEIVQVIHEIGAKTKVINDIVFQTKLLSFNASVEAARAGEHGKGFAVVAEEVGNLAAMSGNAAKEIGVLLSGSIEKVEGMVLETKTRVEGLIANGKRKVESGTSTAHRCAEVLNEIVTNVSHVAQMAGEIASASEDQSKGVGELTKTMNQLDQTNQMNSSSSEQTAAAAETLSRQAVDLNQAVVQLAGLIGGESTDQKAA